MKKPQRKYAIQKDQGMRPFGIGYVALFFSLAAAKGCCSAALSPKPATLKQGVAAFNRQNYMVAAQILTPMPSGAIPRRRPISA